MNTAFRSFLRVFGPSVAVLLPFAAGAGGEARLIEQFADGSGEFECMHCRAAWAAAAGLGDADAGWEDERYDPVTGADKSNYPPTRGVDFQHMRLEIDVPDMNTPVFKARQTLTMAAVGQPVDSVRLNAKNLDIAKVRATGRGQGVAFSHDGSNLELTFDPPLAPGATHDVQIEYVCKDPVDGLTWTPESKAWAGRKAQFHTQGQPETNQHWFPCHDSPNERLTTEIVVTVPEGFIASANGRLAEQKTEGGRSTFHWTQDKPHANYLVSLVVGEFDVVDVGRGQLDMPVYAPVGKAGLVEQTYGRTLDMMRVFEDRFGHAYPWDRYAQLIVWNFGAGGMENTSATTMYDTAILDEKALQDADLDGLISHELGHQWFGDLITCDSWAHIWLNEGFATYSTALWYEARDGYDPGYLAQMNGTMRGLAGRDKLDPKASKDSPSGGARPGMVSRVYEHPWQTFRRVSNPYPKGCSILHMLRMHLGDDVFFQGLRAYVTKYQLRTVETDDLRRTLEEVSGRSLDQFFEQWCMRPGTPETHVKATWSEKSNELKIVVEQKQRIDADHPAFVFDLPIEVWTTTPTGAASASGTAESIVMSIDGRRHERIVTLDSAPTMVVVDPDLHVLTDLKLDVPKAWLINQAASAHSTSARLDAVRALAEEPGDETEEALKAIVLDSEEHHTVRMRAADSLGTLNALETLMAIAEAGVDDARPRRSAISALGDAANHGGEGAAEAVALIARTAGAAEESYAVRAAALRALGEIGDESHLPILLAALEVDSQHEQVREGALRGLAALDAEEGLEAAIRFAQPGWNNRLRPDAISAIATLAEHDEDMAFEAVAPLLFDSEERARGAARSALVRMKDERGVAELRRHAAALKHEVERVEAEEAADRLAAAIRRDDPTSTLREDIEKLKRELEELKHKVDEGK